MKITTNELKRLCEKILTSLEKSGINEIEIDFDYYWKLNSDDVYNFSREPEAKMVGSFLDDLECLQEVLHDKAPVTVLDLERLGNVVNTVGTSIEKSNMMILDIRDDIK